MYILNNHIVCKIARFSFLEVRTEFFFFSSQLHFFPTIFDMDTAVTPGQRLGYAEDYIAGPGTYEREGLLYASVVGFRRIRTRDEGKVRLENYSVSWSRRLTTFNP